MVGKLFLARSDVTHPDMRTAKWIAIRGATVPHSRLTQDVAHAHKQKFHNMATVCLKSANCMKSGIHIAFPSFVLCLILRLVLFIVFCIIIIYLVISVLSHFRFVCFFHLSIAILAPLFFWQTQRFSAVDWDV